MAWFPDDSVTANAPLAPFSMLAGIGPLALAVDPSARAACERLYYHFGVSLRDVSEFDD